MTKQYLSNKDESIPLFENKLLDKFTDVHPSVPVILYLPVISFFFYQAFVNTELSFSMIIFLFFFGIILWRVTEYLLHRYVFHFPTKSDFGNYISDLMHGVHHDYPNDSRRLVMPPLVSMPLVFIFFGLFTLIFGASSRLPIFSGFVFGYVCYDMIHYATHHFPLKNRMGLWIKHHHTKHHYQTEALGFGVSSPLWDYVFRTIFRRKK